MGLDSDVPVPLIAQWSGGMGSICFTATHHDFPEADVACVLVECGGGASEICLDLDSCGDGEH